MSGFFCFVLFCFVGDVLFCCSAFQVVKLDASELTFVFVCHRARMYQETISTLQNISMQLAARPETSPAYNIRLLPLSTERSALLAQFAIEEKNAVESTEGAYELESQRVQEEWEKGRAKIRERLLEGIEERRRRAREEKDGEGIGGGTPSFPFILHLFLTRYFTRFLSRLPIPPPHHPQTAQQTRHLPTSNPKLAPQRHHQRYLRSRRQRQRHQRTLHLRAPNQPTLPLNRRTPLRLPSPPNRAHPRIEWKPLRRRRRWWWGRWWGRKWWSDS